MSTGRICSRTVHTARASERVAEAARRMAQLGVGSLVVVDPARRPVGILTDRDLVVRVMAAGLDAADVCVAEVMTRQPQSLWEHSPVEDALAAMRSGAFRRLPVTDADGRLVGLVSTDDVLELLAEELDDVRRLVAVQGHAKRATPA